MMNNNRLALEKPRRPWYMDRAFMAVVVIIIAMTILIYARYELKSNQELGTLGEVVVAQNRTLVVVNDLNQTLLPNGSIAPASQSVAPEVKAIKNLLTDINKTLSNPNRTLNVKNTS